MDQNSKKTPTADELDSFWDISALMPRSRTAKPRRAGSVEAVEITIDNTAEASEAVKSQRLTTNVPTKSERGETQASAPHSIDQAPPPTPDDDYAPTHRLIHRVRIYDKSGVYNYYEQFLNHARKIARLRGNECPPVPFFSYVPQFSQLTKPQLNWYLWWRECLWNGSCLETDFSYILLYVYEIINTGGHDNPAWGQRQLCTVWRNYRRTYPRLDRLLGDWICDFSLLHHLPPPLKYLDKMIGEALPSCTLKEFYMSGEDGDNASSRGAMLITFCSNYNYLGSKFCMGDNKPLYNEHIPKAIERLAERYTDEQGRLASGGGIETSHLVRDAYSGALCSCAIRKRMEIDYSSFSRSYELRFMITDGVKYAENKLRAHLGIKSRLNFHSLTAEMRRCIDEYFDVALPSPAKKEPERAEYEKLYDAPAAPLSLENAALIEQTSWETTERLIEAFEEEQAISEPAIQPVETAIFTAHDAVSNPSALAEALAEYMDFLRLADRGDATAMRRYATERGEMVELFVDKINEISVEIFGDVILEELDGAYCIIQEYRKEIFND